MPEKQTMVMPEAELEPRPGDLPIRLDRLDLCQQISLFKQLKAGAGVERRADQPGAPGIQVAASSAGRGSGRRGQGDDAVAGRRRPAPLT